MSLSLYKINHLCFYDIIIFSVSNDDETSISEVGKQALREAEELVEARRIEVDHCYS